jgi:hypothetical protein
MGNFGLESQVKMRLTVLCALLTIGAVTGSTQDIPVPRGLSAPLANFVVVKKTVADTLQELADRSRPNAVIGFEHVVASDSPRIDVTVQSGTVADALAAICADGRYTYSEAAPGVVELRPTEEPAELRALMNLPIPSLDLDVREWPGNLFGRVAQSIPELRAYLSAKAMSWAQQTGQPVRATPGLAMSTDVTPPLIKIQLRNTTLRGVLSALAAYTLENAPRDRSVRPFYSASGWRVEFTPDPHSPTGLGGDVRWSPFPFR